MKRVASIKEKKSKKKKLGFSQKVDFVFGREKRAKNKKCLLYCLLCLLLLLLIVRNKHTALIIKSQSHSNDKILLDSSL